LGGWDCQNTLLVEFFKTSRAIRSPSSRLAQATTPSISGGTYCRFPKFIQTEGHFPSHAVENAIADPVTVNLSTMARYSHTERIRDGNNHELLAAGVKVLPSIFLERDSPAIPRPMNTKYQAACEEGPEILVVYCNYLILVQINKAAMNAPMHATNNRMARRMLFT
jgi:hypothetical protein